MSERRQGKRHRSWFAMRLGAKEDEWLAMSRNVSQTGALVALAKRLEVGEEVTITFSVSATTDDPIMVKGCIVRVEPNAEDPEGLWPHRVAVQFVDVVAEVEALLTAAAESWSDDYLVEMELGKDCTS